MLDENLTTGREAEKSERAAAALDGEINIG